MIEIKLRAWCAYNKEMYTDDNSPEYTFNISQGTVSLIPNNGFDDLNSFYSGIADDIENGFLNIIPMQFTGLTDKNKVDIYEGDICEVDNNENANHLQTVNCNYAKTLKKGDILIIKKLLSGYTGQILSNQGEQPSLIGNVCNYSLWNGSRQLKVIGNIYQNSELLTNK